MRYAIRPGQVACAHPSRPLRPPVCAWVIRPRGWTRRTVMDRNGRALFTVWTRPGA